MTRLGYQIPNSTYPDTTPRQLFDSIVAQANAPTVEEADRDLVRMAEIKGWNDERVEIAKTMLVFGDPDTVGEQLADVKATGVDGFTINLAVNGYITERIALLGEVAGKVLG